MKTIQIRNVPESVHATLRARAAAAGMSLSDYVLDDITRTADRPEISEVLRRASARSGGTTQAEIVRAIHAGRDER